MTKRKVCKNMKREDIETTLSILFEDIKNDPHHRYRSWEYCYKYFNENVKNKKRIDEDLTCLNLAYYLASWGMYRGSSVLLNKTYTFFKPIVEIFLKDNYKNLWEIDFKNKDYSKEEIKSIVENINELYYKIRNSIKESIPTKTLLTKILLGVMACTPAYDNFFKKGLKKILRNDKRIIPYGNKHKDKICIKEFYALIEFYRNNKSAFDEDYYICKSNQHELLISPYPAMRLIDMYFWKKGQLDNEKR